MHHLSRRYEFGRRDQVLLEDRGVSSQRINRRRRQLVLTVVVGCLAGEKNNQCPQYFFHVERYPYGTFERDGDMFV